MIINGLINMLRTMQHDVHHRAFGWDAVGNDVLVDCW
jgi:hypothetical protein